MVQSPSEQLNRLRYRTTLLLVAFYLIPLVLITLYNVSALPLSQGWGILSTGLVAMAVGSILLFLTLQRWETLTLEQAARDVSEDQDLLYKLSLTSEEPHSIAETLSVSQDDLQKLTDLLTASQKQCELLSEELHREQRSLEGLHNDRERLEHLLQQAQQALDSQNSTFHEQQQAQDVLHQEYQQTIADQRQVIEKKQQQVQSLEGEVKDLKYELKTLLSLTEAEDAPRYSESTFQGNGGCATKSKPKSEKVEAAPTPLELGLSVPSRSHEEAQQQLKRCIDIAQKLTGARHLAGDSSRFRDLSADGYALDLRRLCDSLLSEQSAVILLYSQRENRMLFANNQVRGMLGWSPDKFLQSFPSIISEGEADWRSALQKAATSQRAEAVLKIKTRSGDDCSVRCVLGSVPTGIFKSHIIIVMYTING